MLSSSGGDTQIVDMLDHHPDSSMEWSVEEDVFHLNALTGLGEVHLCS